jgi:hypothetical protein
MGVDYFVTTLIGWEVKTPDCQQFNFEEYEKLRSKMYKLSDGKFDIFQDECTKRYISLLKYDTFYCQKVGGADIKISIKQFQDILSNKELIEKAKQVAIELGADKDIGDPSIISIQNISF